MKLISLATAVCFVPLTCHCATLIPLGSLTRSATWTLSGSPYVIDSLLRIPVGITLTIQAGVVIKFGSESCLCPAEIEVSGTLRALGTDTDPVVFTSYQDDSLGGDTNMDGMRSTPRPGDWQEIWFTEGSRGTLEHVIIRYGGAKFIFNRDPAGACVIVNSSNVILRDCLIEESPTAALWVQDSQPNISSNVFRASRFAMHLEGTAAATQASSNFVTQNTFNGVFVSQGSIDRNVTWKPGPVYILDGLTVAENAMLTIEAGVIIKSLKKSLVNVDAPWFEVLGGISIKGSREAPVILTSLSDDSSGGDTNSDGGNSKPAPGDWLGLNLYSAVRSFIGNSVIRYGGGDQFSIAPFGANLTVSAKNLILENSVISDSRNVGIRIDDSSPLIVSNSIVRNLRGAVINTWSRIVDAERNFWGHETGPLDRSDDRLTGGFYNRSGQGGNVSDFVDYQNWLPTDPNEDLLPVLGPSIIRQPVDLVAFVGGDARLQISAAGTAPLKFTWEKDGKTISNTDEGILDLGPARISDSGQYTVTIHNRGGSVQSKSVVVWILESSVLARTIGRLTIGPIPERLPSADSLILVTHGWQPLGSFLTNLKWLDEMESALQSHLSPNWQVFKVEWFDEAAGLPPMAASNGRTLGVLYGKGVAKQGWSHVHLIGHSAGAALIQGVAEALQDVPLTIHTTFLDPYLGFDAEAKHVYGQGADWSDCYFTQDWTGNSTGGGLTEAFNVDVTYVDPKHAIVTIPCESATSGSTVSPLVGVCGFTASSTHDWPHDYYTQSIGSPDTLCTAEYGFALSKERLGDLWPPRVVYPVKNIDSPKVPCGSESPLGRQESFPVLGPALDLTATPHLSSGTGASLDTRSTFRLTATPSLILNENPRGSVSRRISSVLPLRESSWMALGLTLTGRVDIVSLSVEMETANSEGLLTVYWNTNEVAEVDQRAALTRHQEVRFALPTNYESRVCSLVFRLEAFTSESASLRISNIRFGTRPLLSPPALELQWNLRGAGQRTRGAAASSKPVRNQFSNSTIT